MKIMGLIIVCLLVATYVTTKYSLANWRHHRSIRGLLVDLVYPVCYVILAVVFFYSGLL